MARFKVIRCGIVDQETGIELINRYCEERNNYHEPDDDWRENFQFNFYDPGFILHGKKISFSFDAKRLSRKIARELNGKEVTVTQWFGYEISSEQINQNIINLNISDQDKIDYIRKFIESALLCSFSSIKDAQIIFVQKLIQRQERPPSVVEDLK